MPIPKGPGQIPFVLGQRRPVGPPGPLLAHPVPGPMDFVFAMPVKYRQNHSCKRSRGVLYACQFAGSELYAGQRLKILVGLFLKSASYRTVPGFWLSVAVNLLPIFSMPFHAGAGDERISEC